MHLFPVRIRYEYGQYIDMENVHGRSFTRDIFYRYTWHSTTNCWTEIQFLNTERDILPLLKWALDCNGIFLEWKNYLFWWSKFNNPIEWNGNENFLLFFLLYLYWIELWSHQFHFHSIHCAHYLTMSVGWVRIELMF